VLVLSALLWANAACSELKAIVAAKSVAVFFPQKLLLSFIDMSLLDLWFWL